jgi:hypothetical protein
MATASAPDALLGGGPGDDLLAIGRRAFAAELDETAHHAVRAAARGRPPRVARGPDA